MSHLTPTSPTLFFTKNDSLDPRWGELATQNLAHSPNWGLIGYSDDLGIILNGGRPGAHQAPSKIKEFFYKMTPSYELWTKAQGQLKEKICDLGDIVPEKSTQGISPSEILKNKNNYISVLEKTQQKASDILSELPKDLHLISLGSGHDYGYVDGANFLKNQSILQSKKPVIINFDAHLDVRPVVENNFHSGTPFFRLMSEFSDQFDFVEIGLQPHCNSPLHWSWALSKNAHLYSALDLRNEQKKSALQALIQSFQGRPCYLSIDIDVFNTSEAPGCSQSWTMGMTMSEFIPLYHLILEQLDVWHLGIYEVSPALDIDHRTSKLAAQILHQLLEKTLLRNP